MATHGVEGNLVATAVSGHADFDQGDQARHCGDHAGIHDPAIDTVAAAGGGKGGSATHACDPGRDGNSGVAPISRQVWQDRPTELCSSGSANESKSKPNNEMVHMHRLRKPLEERTVCGSNGDQCRHIDPGSIQRTAIRSGARGVHIGWVIQEWERCGETMHPDLSRFAKWAVENVDSQNAVLRIPLTDQQEEMASSSNRVAARTAVTSRVPRQRSIEAALDNDTVIVTPMVVDLISDVEDDPL
eukprot:6491144-Amphidinium_carterae.2